jgi:hypothetical protein
VETQLSPACSSEAFWSLGAPIQKLKKGENMVKERTLEVTKKLLAILVLWLIPKFITSHFYALYFLFEWGPILICSGLLILLIGQEAFGKWEKVNIWKPILVSYLLYILWAAVHVVVMVWGMLN